MGILGVTMIMFHIHVLAFPCGFSLTCCAWLIGSSLIELVNGQINLLYVWLRFGVLALGFWRWAFGVVLLALGICMWARLCV